MKIACLGDLHATSVQPKKRLDNYWETWKEKFIFTLDYCKDNDVGLILQPGDLFDSHKASNLVKQTIISLLNKYRIPFCVVYGQHDLRYHNSNKEDTPTKVLEASERLVAIRNDDKLYFTNDELSLGVYGASWNEDIPEINKERDVNILVTHRMVIKDKKVWYGQESYTTTQWLLKNTNFDLIICGDNHASFSATQDSRHIVNCGSMMRKRTDQEDHKPCFYVYDTEEKTIEKVLIPVKPFSEVMDMDEVKKEKEDESRFQKLVDELNKENEIQGLDYTKNVYRMIKNNSFKEGVVSFLEEVMDS